MFISCPTLRVFISHYIYNVCITYTYIFCISSIYYPYRAGCIDILQLFDSAGVDTQVCDNRGQTVDQIVGKDWRKLHTSTSSLPPASPASPDTPDTPDTLTSTTEEDLKTSQQNSVGEKELEDDVLFEEGYILKGTGLQKKKRYFVLSNSHLLYFKGRSDFTVFRATGGKITYPESAQVEMRYMYVCMRVCMYVCIHKCIHV